MSSLQEGAAKFVHPDMTVSDKIRALAQAGYPRAEIARLLGKRYQHVRNVLEADRVRQAGPMRTALNSAPTAAAPARSPGPSVQARSGGIFRLVIGPDGSVPIPLPVAEAMGVGPGGVLMGRFDGTEFVLISGLESARRAQALMLSYDLEPGRSLTDELIADRRREAAEEERD